MTQPAPAPSIERQDHATDQLIGRLLQVGVAAAAIVLLAGWVLFLVHHGMDAADVRDFHRVPTTVPDVLRAALSLRAEALMQLGIVLLIATPVARVALTVVAFARRRDGIFVVLSAAVLLILLYGMFWSGGAP